MVSLVCGSLDFAQPSRDLWPPFGPVLSSTISVGLLCSRNMSLSDRSGGLLLLLWEYVIGYTVTYGPQSMS